MSNLKNLIQMTSGGNVPGMPVQQDVMPPAAVNAAPPTTFQPGVVAQAPQPQAPQVAPAPVQAPAPVAAAPQPQQPQTLRQMLPPTGPAVTISVVEDGRVANVQAPAPVQAPVAPAANVDPLHAQLFGTPVAQAPQVQQFAPQVQQPKPPLPTVESLFQPAVPPMNSGPIIPVPPIEEEDDFDPDADWGSGLVEDHDDEYVGVAEQTAAPEPVVIEEDDGDFDEAPPALPLAPAAVAKAEEPAVTINEVQFPSFGPQAVENPGQHTEDDELAISENLMAMIEKDMQATEFALGIALLSNSEAYDKNNPAHEAIWYARWNREGLMKLDVDKILEFGVALSVHQVWVAGEENKWKARYDGLGTELSDLTRKKRRGESGKTEGEKEDLVFKKQPAMRELRRQFVQAKAMATMLGGMAERFAQLENCLKRPADKKAAEQNRNTTGRDWTR